VGQSPRGNPHVGGAGGIGDDVAHIAAAILPGDDRDTAPLRASQRRGATSRIEMGRPEQT